MPALPEPPTRVGAAIPAHTPHAISVMFPTWQDNILYEEGNPIVTSKMECGYPRFFIHPFIQKLCARLIAKFGKENDSGMLFPSHKVAEQCRSFMKRYYKEPTGTVRIAEFEIVPNSSSSELQRVPIHIVLFPQDAFPIAKQFWQHAGDIISSRMAEYCLRILDENSQKSANNAEKSDKTDLYKPKQTMGSRNRSHYSSKPVKKVEQKDEEAVEQTTYLEERYGRNLPVKFANDARVALRRRIAGVLIGEEEVNVSDLVNKISSIDLEEQRQVKGERGIKGLSEDDVYLYPCGMSAIYHAHQISMILGDQPLQSICFGFPYTDTLKILQKWGPGCIFLGLGEEESIDELEELLKSGQRFLSLFCELPSNPLLKSPNIKRLRRLADEYGFFIVVDETIGNFCNVGVLEWADLVVSSLTKIFSGDSNVMGGSMILNPNGKYYDGFKAALKVDYEDLLWSEDVLFLERNSRNFKERSRIINRNAEELCDYLITHEKVEKVYYPKYTSRENYDSVKHDTKDAGYGGLFSIVLKDEKSAASFYDNLHCAKGPSLGTNFTLCSPYTILAHFTELDWAAQFGVCPYLVRVSVGLEDREKLLSMFKHALDAVN
ncbi:pyridoxal phosphate-dependent transferase [Mucor mucedo]|uniref:pyridoxal phosphate-dependent transferase n=1 Tax=Mucor mucedo TaxID=29922 RepID=UPI00221F049D|nr:pyridoxal phosphate-dependent transferase [Mucor mucedo]KAI7892933.1 pyridoxal phosphate-dependent transferase [Mucor mucedo]